MTINMKPLISGDLDFYEKWIAKLAQANALIVSWPAPDEQKAEPDASIPARSAASGSTKETHTLEGGDV